MFHKFSPRYFAIHYEALLRNSLTADIIKLIIQYYFYTYIHMSMFFTALFCNYAKSLNAQLSKVLLEAGNQCFCQQCTRTE